MKPGGPPPGQRQCGLAAGLWAAACFALPLCAPLAQAQEGAPPCDMRQHVAAFDGKPHQEIAFTYQDCPDGGQAALLFQPGPDNLLSAMRGGAPTGLTVQFFSLRGQAPQARIRQIAEPLAAPEDKGRCMVAPGVVPGTWRYGPDAAYTEELEANGLWGACGPYGDASDPIQYWMVVSGALAAYVSAGLDAPPFAPSSFTYRNTKTPGLVE
jgi:hypothetical protein